MKRQEFIDALRARLNRLPAEELEDALDYYNEIFLDAGEDNEEETAESLGSIDDIARQIYAENGIEPDGRPTFILDERREEDRSQEPSPEMPVQRGYSVRQQQPINTTKVILMIALFPLWLPLLIVCFVLTLVFFILGFVLEIVLVAAGTAMIIGGIVTCFKIPPAGLMSIGIGLFMVGLFILSVKAVFKGSFNVFAGLINKLVGVAHNIFVGGETNV